MNYESVNMSAENENFKANILWHDLWVQGPMVGVCEFNDEKVIYARNKEGKYDLRRFKEGAYKEAERQHFAYRAANGGHRDHNPELFAPCNLKENEGLGSAATKTFDYIGNGVSDVIATLEPKDFKWFHPPKKHTPHTFGRPEDINNEGGPGVDMQDASDDSDDSDDSDSENDDKIEEKEAKE